MCCMESCKCNDSSWALDGLIAEVNKSSTTPNRLIGSFLDKSLDRPKPRQAGYLLLKLIYSDDNLINRHITIDP